MHNFELQRTTLHPGEGIVPTRDSKFNLFYILLVKPIIRGQTRVQRPPFI